MYRIVLFTGESDKVACFKCDVGIYQWGAADEPLTEHIKHSPKCEFALRAAKNSAPTAQIDKNE
jgi:hypothetical protein